MHEVIQQSFKECYSVFNSEVKASQCFSANELYGELYYYSVLKLLKNLNMSSKDHFLDIGSGLGKLVFQIFLNTNAYAVSGVEINKERHAIAHQAKELLRSKFTHSENQNRQLNMLLGDFLDLDFPSVTIIYVCSTVFSYELLEAMGKKINAMPGVHTVVTLRKFPDLLDFKLKKKFFLQGTWDSSVCYIYNRES